MTNKSFFLTITLLTFVTLSCGSLIGGDTAEPTERVRIDPLAETQQPADPAAELPAETADEEAASLPEQLPADYSFRKGLANLSAYQAHLLITQADGSMEVLYETTSQPPAEHVEVTTNGIAIDKMGQTGSMVLYRIDNTGYLQLATGNPWISFSQESPGFFVPGFFIIENVLTPFPATIERSSAPEIINGVSAYRYNFSDQPLNGMTAQGNIWVAEQGRYVVKIEASSPDGTFNLDYQLSQINEDIAITLPEEARNATSMDLSAPDSAVDEAITPTPEPPPAPDTPGEGDEAINETTDETADETTDGAAAEPTVPANQSGLPLVSDAEIVESSATDVTYLTSFDMIYIADFYYNELRRFRWIADETFTPTVTDNTLLAQFVKAADAPGLLTLEGEKQADGRVQVTLTVTGE